MLNVLMIHLFMLCTHTSSTSTNLNEKKEKTQLSVLIIDVIK